MTIRNYFDLPFRLFNDGDGGSGGSTPPSAPAGDAAPSAPSSPSATPSDAPEPDTAGNEFDALGQDFDLDVEVLPSDAPKPAPAPAPAPAAATPAEPKAPVVPPQPQAPAPAQTAQPGGQQEPAAPAAPSSPAEPQSLVAAMEANREALIGQLAQDTFALSKEEIAALETDVVGALPRFMAKVYLKAVQTAINHIQGSVPQLIQRHQDATTARTDTEKAFYGKYPGLDQGKHHGDVTNFALAFRQVNPNISQDELWAMVAGSVAAKYGLNASAKAAAPNGGTPPRPAQPEPFVPARPGTVVRATPDQENAWAALGQTFDED